MKNKITRNIFVFLCILLLSNIILSKNRLIINGIPNENQIVLSSYEYHIISVNATKGQALSGDWSVTPADIITPPFLIFIVDSVNLGIWEASDNLTQAVKRIPANELIYLYDPLFRIDDIPGDNFRRGVFQVKVPFSDTWNLVLYAGPTPFLLTFNWNIDIFEGFLLDVVLYSLLGVCFVIAITIFTIKAVKDRKLSYEKEFEKIIQEEKTIENGERRKNSLEENNEDYIEY